MQDPGIAPGTLKSEMLPVPGDMPRGVGIKLSVRFALGFDLALPSDFLGITEPGTGIHGTVQTQPIFGEFGAPAPPEGDGAREAQCS